MLQESEPRVLMKLFIITIIPLVLMKLF